MAAFVQIESGDRQLLAGIAAALEDAARRSGEWLVCRPGCTECCIGPFKITPLDAWRLRRGLAELGASDPDRARRVRRRAEAYVAAIKSNDEDGLPESMDDVPCPALDPDTGRCDLYEARPITCRSFGPVTRTGDETFAACHLCYDGATDEQMADCAVEIDPEDLEAELLAGLEGAPTIGSTVAHALAPLL